MAGLHFYRPHTRYMYLVRKLEKFPTGGER